MSIENNDVSMMGGNVLKSFIKIIWSPPNGNMLDFNFCNFNCIVTNIIQPTIDISSTIINWMSDQLFGIVLDLFIIVFLSIDKPSKEWIVVPPINEIAFVVYVVMRNLSLLFVFKKYSLIALMICVLPILVAPPMYCSSWLVEFIFMNISNTKNCRLFNLYFFIMKVFKDMGE